MRNLSRGVGWGAVAVAILCTGTSIQQAAAFLSSLATTDIQRAGLVVATIAIIGSSFFIVRLIGLGSRRGSPGWMLALAIMTVLAVESFSIFTSAQAFSNHVYRALESERAGSDEYRLALNTVNNIQSSINSLQANHDRLPDNYLTRRQAVMQDIAALNGELVRAQRQLKATGPSAKARTFLELERSTGFTPAYGALLAAVLLSLIPAVVGLLVSNLSGTRGNRGGGKVSKPGESVSLRSVG